MCTYYQEGGWHERMDPCIGTYSFKNNQWITSETDDSMLNNAVFIRKYNLLGFSTNALHFPDKINRCKKGKYPLLPSMHNALRDSSHLNATCRLLRDLNITPTTVIAATSTSAPDTNTTISLSTERCPCSTIDPDHQVIKTEP